MAARAGAGSAVRGAGGYRLDLPGASVDAARFESTLAEARRRRLVAGTDEVAALYQRALAR